MTDAGIVLPTSLKRQERYDQLTEYASQLKDIQLGLGQKVSQRGWAYVLEGEGLITKDQFDKVTKINGECVDKGILPVDFFLEDLSRQFANVEEPFTQSPAQDLVSWLQAALEAEDQYVPNWWEGEDYYIQMLVEKVDIKEMFKSITREYHIPIATSKGWSSKLQRATYARRFKDAEYDGLQCVLLYLGDHDPDGIRIADFIRENLKQLEGIVWSDGETGYDPEDLIIKRFGLNYDFILQQNLPWVDNLITSSGKNLASPQHPNHSQQYVQDYLHTIGTRKCEANAVMGNPERRYAAIQLCRNAIEEYLGADSRERFRNKRLAVKDRFEELNKKTGYKDAIRKVIDIAREGDQ